MSKMYEIIYITRLTHKQTLNEKMDEAASLNVWKVKADETKAQTLNTALTLLYKRLSPTSPAQQLQASSWVQKSVTWILQAIPDKCETRQHPLFRLKLICVSLKALRLRLALTTPFFSVLVFRRSTLRASRFSCRRSWRANSPRSSVNTSSCRLATRDPNPVPHLLTSPESLVSVGRKS